MNPSAIKINELFQSIGLPTIPAGEQSFYQLLESNIAKLVSMADAATDFVQNREEATEHIWYTNGDRGRRLLEALGISYEPKE